MKKIVALFVLVALPVLAGAQELRTYCPKAFWSVFFTAAPDNAETVDSEFAALQSGGVFAWSLPQPLADLRADSIGVWLETSDSCQIEIETAFDANDYFADTTIEGPLPYGCYEAPFRVQPGHAARYILVQALAPPDQARFVRLDAACLITKQPLSVREQWMGARDESTEWYSLPVGISVLRGSEHEARAKLKAGLYIARDGRRLIVRQ